MLQSISKIHCGLNQKKYPSYHIYIPKDLINDSAFPLNVNDKIVIKIENQQLIIEKHNGD